MQNTAHRFHASCMRTTVYFTPSVCYAVFFRANYELYIAYSIPLYRICTRSKTVDKSGKTDAAYPKLWITVWTVWKCMRLCTPCERNEYTRMDAKIVEKARICEVCPFSSRKTFMHGGEAAESPQPASHLAFSQKVLPCRGGIQNPPFYKQRCISAAARKAILLT